MKRILALLLVSLLLLGNIGYAQGISGSVAGDAYSPNYVQLSSRGHHNGRERDRHERYERRDRHHDEIDAGDILAGIVLYEVVKEIVD